MRVHTHTHTLVAMRHLGNATCSLHRMDKFALLLLPKYIIPSKSIDLACKNECSWLSIYLCRSVVECTCGCAATVMWQSWPISCNRAANVRGCAASQHSWGESLCRDVAPSDLGLQPPWTVHLCWRLVGWAQHYWRQLEGLQNHTREWPASYRLYALQVSEFSL